MPCVAERNESSMNPLGCDLVAGNDNEIRCQELVPRSLPGSVNSTTPIRGEGRMDTPQGIVIG